MSAFNYNKRGDSSMCTILETDFPWKVCVLNRIVPEITWAFCEQVNLVGCGQHLSFQVEFFCSLSVQFTHAPELAAESMYIYNVHLMHTGRMCMMK